MRIARRFVARIAGLLARSRRERELSAEIDAHLQMHIDDYMAGGMSASEARRQALLKFGPVEAIKEEYRDRSRVPVLDHFVRDMHYAGRLMRKTPSFTVVAVLALALGIGVNTTVFTAFNAVALRPLAVKDPQALIRVYGATSSDPYGALSYADYGYYRDHARTLSDLAMLAFGMGLTSSDVAVPQATTIPRLAGALGFHLPQLLSGSARPLGCAFVSGNYFPLLGVPASLGRFLEPADDRPGASPVVLMSGNFWQRQFHGDPAVVGSTLHLNGVPFTVVGITPVDFIGTAQNVPDLWAPIATKLRLGMPAAQLADPDVLAGWVEGRLRREASLADARSELNVLASNRPGRARRTGVTVTSGRTYAPPFDLTAWTVTVATLVSVLLLLLIACTNVASLLLARAAVRRREIALRLALGASRGRLLAQLLTEAVLLAVIAGVAGLLASVWMLHLLLAAVSSALPEYWGTIALQLGPDLRVFGYTLLVSVATGIAFGLAPAVQASNTNLQGALKDDGGAAVPHVTRRRLLDAFVLAQVSACLVLLVSSALLLRSSQAALHADAGFDTRHVIQLQMFNPAEYGHQRDVADLTSRIIDDISRIPGVVGVARASRQPVLSGDWGVPVTPAGETSRPDIVPRRDVRFNRVSPNYFVTLGIQIVRGRTFTDEEAAGGGRVAIVSAAMAERYFPGREPLGQRLAIGDTSHRTRYPGGTGPPEAGVVEVVGVAQDVRSADFRRIDDAYLYLPLSSAPRWTGTLLVRTDGDPARLLSAIGPAIRRTDVDVPVLAGVLDEMISFDPRFVVSRIGGALASIVAGFGLLMAALGVYGMVSYSVAQRTREIGIRIALGAERLQVVRLVLKQGTRPVAAGILCGLLASVVAARVMSSLLFGVAALDALSFGVASAILVAVAVVAIWMPARRATRVDPMIALRHE